VSDAPTSSRWYAGGYWPARKEPVEACAARAERFLHGLAGIDSRLSAWFQRGRRPYPLEPIDVTAAGLVELFNAGRNRYDSDGSVIEELGYRIGAWNGDPDDTVSLSIHCGSFEPNPRISNSVVVELPRRCAAADRPTRQQAALDLMRLIAETWEPDWATLVSDELREAQGPRQRRPVLGWLTFLSGDRGAVPPLEAPFRVEPFAGGSIVAVGDGPPEDPGVLGDLETLLGPDLLRPAHEQ
jgi:Immunity protein 52